jgi:hypothetical protein
MLRDSSNSPATNTVLTNPPYIYTTGSLSMIISTNSASNGIQELELFGVYQSTPSTQTSAIFTVEFTSDCLNSQVFAPSAVTNSVTVNAVSPSPILLTGFTTEILGCETQVVYSCSACPSFVTYQSSPDRIAISPTLNTQVGTY